MLVLLLPPLHQKGVPPFKTTAVCGKHVDLLQESSLEILTHYSPGSVLGFGHPIGAIHGWKIGSAARA